MSIPQHNKEDIITYRIEKAYHTFREAVDNAQMGYWSLAANRLYYAVFYMALAINLKNGDSAKSHSGTFNLLSKRIKTEGILSHEEGNLYRTLFSMRQSGDYDDLFDWDQKDILPLIPRVESLLGKMKDLLLQNLDHPIQG